MNETKYEPATGSAQLAKHHLLIAGTGRAGTSFLVRYLTELGLDTTLSRNRDGQVMWDDTANAGLEEIVNGTGENLPYVVKSPWIGQYFEQILANPHIAVDAILIPVRDLVEAATSRTVLEMRAMHESAPWMAELDQSWEVWGTTPGGVVYSVNPLDQARLLAVSFHDLIWRATKAEIPVHFLAFPKIIEDKNYLFRALQPVLPPEVTPDLAYLAHERIADPAKVRVGGEDAVKKSQTSPTLYRGPASLPHADVDMLALRRELVRVRGELLRVSEDADRFASEAVGLKSGSEGLQSEVARLTSEVASLLNDSARLSNEIAGLRMRAETPKAKPPSSRLQLPPNALALKRPGPISELSPTAVHGAQRVSCAQHCQPPGASEVADKFERGRCSSQGSRFSFAPWVTSLAPHSGVRKLQRLNAHLIVSMLELRNLGVLRLVRRPLATFPSTLSKCRAGRKRHLRNCFLVF